DLLSARNTLTQCMQDNSFQFTASLDLSRLRSGTHTGLAMFEKSASGLEVVQSGNERRLNYFRPNNTTPGPLVRGSELRLRVRIEGDQATYFYSLDRGRSFQQLGSTTPIHFSWWKGSRPALFAYSTESTNPGSVDIDWVHVQPFGTNPW